MVRVTFHPDKAVLTVLKEAVSILESLTFIRF